MTTQQASNVLLVEDDASMLSVLRMLLELEGFQVTTSPDFQNIDDLVSFIDQTQPDILLLDVHIHKLNGIDILRKLRSDPANKKTRIVMSSGMNIKDDCIAAGADSFLLKPYMPDELIKNLRG